MSILQAAARKKAPAKTRLTRKQAARVLKRSILGPRKSEIDALVGGNYEQWLDQQMQMPVWQPLIELHQTSAPGSRARRARLANGTYVDISSQEAFAARRELCLRFIETEHPDVLRHRVCNALLEILVCSVVGNDSFGISQGALTGYYSRLQRRCFSTYYDILRDISLSPEMAIYLTYSGNKKANTATGAQPDENYAREIMQLFSIGLFELNLDGTRKKTGELDPTDPRYVLNGQDEVPTYGADDIKNVARIFTGTLVPRADVASPESARFSGGQRLDDLNFSLTTAYPLGALSNLEFFSTDNEVALPKQALPGTGGFLLNIPAGTGGAAAFDALLTALVNHPSCAPYVSKRLIQLLTCSNPRPEYVARVANVFRNNGMNQVGDMKAVLKAIFLDQDALAEPELGLSIKARDIDLALRSAMRSQTSTGIIDTNNIVQNISVAAGRFSTEDLEHRNFTNERGGPFSKYPMQAPSVFGRWPVEFSTKSAQAQGLVVPELHTWDGSQVSFQSSQGYKNRMRNLFNATSGTTVSVAMSNANLSATFDQVAEVMSGLEIKPAVKTAMLTYIQGVADTNQRFDRMIECLTLTAVSAFQE